MKDWARVSFSPYPFAFILSSYWFLVGRNLKLETWNSEQRVVRASPSPVCHSLRAPPLRSQRFAVRGAPSSVVRSPGTARGARCASHRRSDRSSRPSERSRVSGLRSRVLGFGFLVSRFALSKFLVPGFWFYGLRSPVLGRLLVSFSDGLGGNLRLETRNSGLRAARAVAYCLRFIASR